MTRPLVGLTLAMAFCLIVSQAYGAPRGGGGGRSGGGRPSGGKPPGGNWSEGKSGGTRGPQTHGNEQGREHNESGDEGAEAGAAASRKKQPQTSGAEGAAAGAAASRKKQPQTSGAEGAAAGAAAANRNQPQASGADGAATGAAASRKKQPQTSGAEGAAAGAAAANRNQPQASGAQGAAAGAAAANRNAPKASGAEGAAAGAAVANRNQPAVSGAAGAVAGSAAVRNSFDHPDLYGQQWRSDHPDAWSASGWAAGAEWSPTNWGTVAAQCGYGNTPVSYNYGGNVTCLDGNVQINGETICSAEEFSQQAADVAQSGADAETATAEEWLPLGVFAMVRNEQQHPQLILQLAINKKGILRGNYTDEITDHTLPIHGAVDKQTQRAAWTVGGNESTVMEAGLSNLTQGEAPALLHKNGQTQRWLLVRLEQPDPSGN